MENRAVFCWTRNRNFSEKIIRLIAGPFLYTGQLVSGGVTFVELSEISDADIEDDPVIYSNFIFLVACSSSDIFSFILCYFCQI